jgi:hypothetical protein
VSLAYVTKGRDKSQALLFGSMFILGLVLTHAVLGIIAGLGGNSFFWDMKTISGMCTWFYAQMTN